jgi:hypothetical protein
MDETQKVKAAGKASKEPAAASAESDEPKSAPKEPSSARDEAFDPL